MAQRLVRAKRKIAAAAIPTASPATPRCRSAGRRAGSRLPRLQRGLRGQRGRGASCAPSCAPRRSASVACCAQLCPTTPRRRGLLALMLIHDARRDARAAATGATSPCPTRTAPAGTRRRSPRAARSSTARFATAPRRPYQLQAAIASLHCEPRSTGRRSRCSTACSPARALARGRGQPRGGPGDGRQPGRRPRGPRPRRARSLPALPRRPRGVAAPQRRRRGRRPRLRARDRAQRDAVERAESRRGEDRRARAIHVADRRCPVADGDAHRAPPRQVVGLIQHVPSACTAATTASVVASSSPKRTRTWLRTTRRVLRSPRRRRGPRRAPTHPEQRSSISATPAPEPAQARIDGEAAAAARESGHPARPSRFTLAPAPQVTALKRHGVAVGSGRRRRATPQSWGHVQRLVAVRRPTSSAAA